MRPKYSFFMRAAREHCAHFHGFCVNTPHNSLCCSPHLYSPLQQPSTALHNNPVHSHQTSPTVFRPLLQPSQPTTTLYSPLRPFAIFYIKTSSTLFDCLQPSFIHTALCKPLQASTTLHNPFMTPTTLCNPFQLPYSPHNLQLTETLSNLPIVAPPCNPLQHFSPLQPEFVSNDGQPAAVHCI